MAQSKPRQMPTDGGEPPRDVLKDVVEGERLAMRLGSGEEITGEVDDTEVTSYPGEPRQRGVTLVTGGGEFAFDITVTLDREVPPTASRTLFADDAARLGRIPEADVDGPDEPVTLDEGTVEYVDRLDEVEDGDA
jgi:hypothetical protein